MSPADVVFLACLVAGGGMLLLTVLVEDFFAGLHLGFDVGGVSPMPMLLGFVSMFGVGGLFGTQVFKVGGSPATAIGVGAGLIGALVVFGMFRVLRGAESSEAFRLEDMIGSSGRVSVAIPANHYGTVYLSFAGGSHNMTATAGIDIPAGKTVTITAVAGSTLVVEPAPASSAERGKTDA